MCTFGLVQKVVVFSNGCVTATGDEGLCEVDTIYQGAQTRKFNDTEFVNSNQNQENFDIKKEMGQNYCTVVKIRLIFTSCLLSTTTLRTLTTRYLQNVLDMQYSGVFFLFISNNQSKDINTLQVFPHVSRRNQLKHHF